MAISDKLTYLNTTKSLIRDGINAIGGELTSSDTFRSYVNALNNIYDYLPKITGTGTSITLNDTAKGKMILNLGSSEISQAGTPTPSSPQDIHTISGSNTIKVCGKNLCKGITQNVFLNFTANVCGVAIGDSGLYIKVDGGTYKVSTTTTQTRYRVGCVMNKPSSTSQTAYNGVNNDNTNYTITINTTGYNYLVVNATDLTKIQIEKGNTATTFEPYNGTDYSVDLGDIEYCKIGTYGDRIFKNVSGDADYSSERDEGAWYIKKNIGKVVLDGSEPNWDTTATNVFASGVGIIQASNYTCLSNYYKYNSVQSSVSSTLNDGEFAMQYNSATTNRLFFKNTNVSTVADWKTWLSSNNVSVYYVLVAPTYTQITGTLADELEAIRNAMSKNEQTNISQVNDDLPFVINASALQDLSTL